MSEKLLLQFLNACDEEDFNRKSKPVKRFDRTRRTKDEVQGLLSAAAKSLVSIVRDFLRFKIEKKLGMIEYAFDHAR